MYSPVASGKQSEKDEDAPNDGNEDYDQRRGT